MYSFRLCCGVEDIVAVGVVKEGLSCACVRGVPNALRWREGGGRGRGRGDVVRETRGGEEETVGVGVRRDARWEETRTRARARDSASERFNRVRHDDG